jgi:hypothetical protein
VHLPYPKANDSRLRRSLADYLQGFAVHHQFNFAVLPSPLFL